MIDDKNDILNDLTQDINLADIFISSIKEKDDFNKTVRTNNINVKPGLSLSRDMYEELEAKCNFEFITTKRKNI